MAVSETTAAADQEEAAPAAPAGSVLARRSAYWAVLAVIGSLVLALPLLVSPVYLNVLARAAVFAMVALSLNILVGYTGQVSLGHSAFFGIGAFGAAYVLTEVGLPWLAGLAFSGVTGAAFAFLLGGVALRVRGLNLALVTLAFAAFAQQTVFQFRWLTRGGAGMPAPRPDFADSSIAYVYVCIVALALALAFDWRLVSTRPGRAIVSLRDDERVAASWGMNVTWYKLLAFVISGAMAGVAGGLFASIEGVVVSPDFEVTISLTFLLMAVLGGLGNRWGVLQAGVFIAVLPAVLDWANQNLSWFPRIVDGSLSPLFVALLVLLTLTLFPGGLAQLQRPLWRRLQGKGAGHGGA